MPFLWDMLVPWRVVFKRKVYYWRDIPFLSLNPMMGGRANHFSFPGTSFIHKWQNVSIG